MIQRLTASWKRTGWKEMVLLLVAGVFCLCLWGFIELADDAPEGDYDDVENKFMRSLRDPNDPSKVLGPWWAGETARDLTALGGATVVTMVTVVVLGYLLLRRAYGAMLSVAIAIGGGYLLSNSLKAFFDRPRPSVVPHLSEAVSASFPSGHSMVSSVAYLTLGALLARTVARRWEKVYVIVISLLLTLLIGTSRVYLGVHYPTDVLAGWSAGIAWALLCWSVTYALQRRGKLRTAAANDAAVDRQDDGPDDPVQMLER